MSLKTNTKRLTSMFSWVKNKLKRSPLYGRTLIILLFIALVVKWIVIYISYKNLNPRENIVSYLASDIIIIFFAHLLVVINYWIKNRKFRLINDFIVFLILIIFLVDIFTIHFFQSRVSVIDAFKFWSNGSSGFSWVIYMWIWAIIIIWIVAFLWIQKLKVVKGQDKKKALIFFSICSILYTLFYVYTLLSNINIGGLDNIFTINVIKSEKTDSEIIDSNENFSYEDYISSTIWMWENLNVILVFAESLSAIDSFNIWWNNNIPKFDEIQKDWIMFTNFITNWKTSDTAHIATLYGVMPLVNVWTDSTPYSGYKLLMDPLPAYLNNQWYNTTFISAASLEFLKQREFLSWAGFQKIIWEEEFEKNKKYTFDAAPDWDLYDRTLEEIKAQTWKYFIWLQTISFHTPYNTPYWKTEQLALKYSDDELYEFYQWLQEIWFFDNWILVIVWDHRKMKPAENMESELFWSNWYTRSVATIVWSWIQSWSVNSELIQHTDFYNSLKRLLWNWYVEVDRTYNDVFSNEINRKRWITSARYFENKNKYTVSILWKTWFTFSNISTLDKASAWELYNYMSSYINYEIGWSINQKHKKTLLIWHQWAPNEAPENSYESFLTAKKQWASGIEFDVSYTKDNISIVAHGEHFYASNCQNLKIKNYWYDWIKENCTLKNWEKYRTLEDMLELIDWLFDYYFLEIKVYDEKLWAQQAAEVIQTVKDLNMQDRVIFISYSDAAREVLDADPDIIYWWDTFDVNDLDFVWENNSKYFLAPYDMMTPEIVERAKFLWKEVATYTINDTWDFQSMKDLWVNIIMSDRVDLLQEYDNTIQYPVPHSLENLNLKKSSGIVSEDLDI